MAIATEPTTHHPQPVLILMTHRTVDHGLVIRGIATVAPRLTIATTIIAIQRTR